MSMDYMAIGLFFGLQLVNVVLSTMRSILTVKAKDSTAAVINAVSYTFYSAIVKMITSQDMVVVITVTFVTNLIGVLIARLILRLLAKDKLWVVNATIKEKNVNVDTVLRMCDDAHIKYVYTEVCPKQLYTVQFFCYEQNETRMIKEILKNYKVKYYIIESK